MAHGPRDRVSRCRRRAAVPELVARQRHPGAARRARERRRCCRAPTTRRQAQAGRGRYGRRDDRCEPRLALLRPGARRGGRYRCRRRHARRSRISTPTTASATSGSTCPTSVVPALEALRARGLRLTVVSNANGTLCAHLERLGLAAGSTACSTRATSASRNRIRGSSRLRSSGAAPDRDTTIHVGDLYHVDVVGARAAGLRGVLLDVAGLYARWTARACGRWRSWSRRSKAGNSKTEDRRQTGRRQTGAGAGPRQGQGVSQLSSL